MKRDITVGELVRTGRWVLFPLKEHLENVHRHWLISSFFENSQLPIDIVTRHIMPLVCYMEHITVYSKKMVCVAGLYQETTIGEECINIYYTPLMKTLQSIFDMNCYPTFTYNNRTFRVGHDLYPKPGEISITTDDHWHKCYVISDTLTFYAFPVQIFVNPKDYDTQLSLLDWVRTLGKIQ